MADGGAEILKLAAGRGPPSSSGHIFLAGPLVEVTKLSSAKMVEDSAEPGGCLPWPSVPCGHILHVDGNDSCNLNVRGIGVSHSWSDLLVQVCCEGSFSFSNFALACASAPLDAAVPDDPYGPFEGSASNALTCWLEPKAGSLTATRHSALIRSMFARVV